jgi:4-diphosphocytidyl-2-C-methyl-D-erythritol kinase
MKYRAFAKINLALDIIKRDVTRYHVIRTVLQEIPLFDEIEIVPLEKEGGDFLLHFEGDEAHIIDPLDNTVEKVFRLMLKQFKFKNSYKIVVHKNIPLGSGLGGGSSDAATVLKALNELENLKLSNDDLRKISTKISMDVPFFIEGGTALGTHFGETIKLLPPLNLSQIHKLLIIPKQRKNTADVYGKVDVSLTNKDSEKTDKLIQAINDNDSENITKNMHNDFELFTDPTFSETKEALAKNNATKVILCGAGTAVFAISNNSFDLKALSQALPHQRILDLNQLEVLLRFS